MPRRDRRDHKPDPGIDYRPHPSGRGGTIVGDVTCKVCHEVINPVYDRTLAVKSRTYWRHLRWDAGGGRGGVRGR